MKISVIGAGPAGSTAAYHLAKKGYDVEIFEEHASVGAPIQCTGLCTRTLENLVPISKKFLVNRTKHIRLHSPNRELEIDSDEYVVCRTRFDTFLCERAQDAGAILHTDSRFVASSEDATTLTIKQKGEIKQHRTDLLIGADGPRSLVAKSAGLFLQRQFLLGMQAVVKAEVDPSIYDAYFGAVSPGLFAWAVPESESAVRIGLGTRTNTRYFFDRFHRQLGSPPILSWQAGLIPLFSNQQTHKENVYLVGDAACQIKDTTAGGIIQGMIAARTLAESIETGASYEKSWRRELYWDLTLHSALRRGLDRLTDADYDRLLDYCTDGRVQKVLHTISRDEPLKLVAGILRAKPQFLFFAKQLLRIHPVYSSEL